MKCLCKQTSTASVRSDVIGLHDGVLIRRLFECVMGALLFVVHVFLSAPVFYPQSVCLQHRRRNSFQVGGQKF